VILRWRAIYGRHNEPLLLDRRVTALTGGSLHASQAHPACACRTLVGQNPINTQKTVAEQTSPPAPTTRKFNEASSTSPIAPVLNTYSLSNRARRSRPWRKTGGTSVSSHESAAHGPSKQQLHEYHNALCTEHPERGMMSAQSPWLVLLAGRALMPSLPAPLGGPTGICFNNAQQPPRLLGAGPRKRAQSATTNVKSNTRGTKKVASCRCRSTNLRSVHLVLVFRRIRSL